MARTRECISAKKAIAALNYRAYKRKEDNCDSDESHQRNHGTEHVKGYVRRCILTISLAMIERRINLPYWSSHSVPGQRHSSAAVRLNPELIYVDLLLAAPLLNGRRSSAGCCRSTRVYTSTILPLGQKPSAEFFIDSYLSASGIVRSSQRSSMTAQWTRENSSRDMHGEIESENGFRRRRKKEIGGNASIREAQDSLVQSSDATVTATALATRDYIRREKEREIELLVFGRIEHRNPARGARVSYT
ncbi:unnamed protein product [Trichogramma brassicae]|uniref:Uncharacterized protein n=1 Tax=Trichogramma brassicae TaxID=86971 RepID=A0A6H5I0G0_9HYME|nr:unnamed protein product [Trichogramma brassicae]